MLDARTEHMEIVEEEPPAATADNINKALSDVASSIFPHRANPMPVDDERYEKPL